VIQEHRRRPAESLELWTRLEGTEAGPALSLYLVVTAELFRFRPWTYWLAPRERAQREVAGR
jgi:hypothetical protein